MSFIHKTEAPTGTASLELKIRQDATGDWLDFADGAFKGAGHTTPVTPMVEPDSAEFPGLFQSATVATAIWADGEYTLVVQDTLVIFSFTPDEITVCDGDIVRPGSKEVSALVVVKSASGDIEFLAWLMVNGRIYAAPTSATTTIYDADGAVFSAAITDLAPDAQGVFRLLHLGAGPVADTQYYATVDIVADGATYSAPAAFSVY